jgi:hypothetical protein
MSLLGLCGVEFLTAVRRVLIFKNICNFEKWMTQKFVKFPLCTKLQEDDCADEKAQNVAKPTKI